MRYGGGCQNPGSQCENNHHFLNRGPLFAFTIHCEPAGPNGGIYEKPLPRYPSPQYRVLSCPHCFQWTMVRLGEGNSVIQRRENHHFDGFQNEFDGWRVLCQVDYSEVGYSVSFCWWVLTLTNQQLEFPPVRRRGNWVRRGRCPELSTDPGWFLGRHFSIFIFIPLQPLHFTTICILVFLNIWIFWYILNIVRLVKNSHGTKCLSTNLPILFQKSYSL